MVLKNKEILQKGCKVFKDDNEMNPNNYDIYIDTQQIPANIQKENTASLEKRLQKLMPLSKKIHVNIENGVKTFEKENPIRLKSKIKFQNKLVIPK